MTETFKNMLESNVSYLGLISSPAIKKFTLQALEKFGNEDKFLEANEVAEYVDEKLKKNKIEIRTSAEVNWIDLLLSATFLHNLFYDGSLHSIFLAREKLTSLGIKNNLSVEFMEPIFQAIEGQLGADMPIASCRVNPHSPSGILAEACWNIEERSGNKKMPDLTQESR